VSLRAAASTWSALFTRPPAGTTTGAGGALAPVGADALAAGAAGPGVDDPQPSQVIIMDSASALVSLPGTIGGWCGR
jgi:hypothetical protein